jgi:hypothetical protein
MPRAAALASVLAVALTLAFAAPVVADTTDTSPSPIDIGDLPALPSGPVPPIEPTVPEGEFEDPGPLPSPAIQDMTPVQNTAPQNPQRPADARHLGEAAGGVAGGQTSPTRDGVPSEGADAAPAAVDHLLVRSDVRYLSFLATIRAALDTLTSIPVG